MTTSKGLLGVAAVLALAGAANAALTITGLGTASPVGQPATAGMTAFPLFDTQPVFADVTSTMGGPFGVVGFDQPLSHRQIGFGWGSWSHGYTGSVYFGAGTSITLTMPTNNFVGFYLYAEPNIFGVFQMQVSASNAGGESAMSPIIGVEGSAGAAGWAFSSTSALTTITVVNTDGGAGGFAIGEFGFAMPAPGALALLGLAGLARGRRRD